LLEVKFIQKGQYICQMFGWYLLQINLLGPLWLLTYTCFTSMMRNLISQYSSATISQEKWT
ncbi:hypothetical protein KI387_017517, partial [Taxus chinensis]